MTTRRYQLDVDPLTCLNGDIELLVSFYFQCVTLSFVILTEYSSSSGLFSFLRGMTTGCCSDRVYWTMSEDGAEGY